MIQNFCLNIHFQMRLVFRGENYYRLNLSWKIFTAETRNDYYLPLIF